MIVNDEMRKFGITGTEEDWENLKDEIAVRFLSGMTNADELALISGYEKEDIVKALSEMNM